MMPDATIMSLNNAAAGLWIVPHHVVTMHGAIGNFIGTPRMPLKWIPEDATVWAYECGGDEHPRVDRLFTAEPIWGTCALAGALVAMYMQFDRIVLVGCDMMGAYGSASKLGAWKPWLPYMKGRVTSLRGNLTELLRN